MKKKHIRALSSIEKWFKEHDALGSEIENALNFIKTAIDDVKEIEVDFVGVLPAPQEIALEPMSVALYSDGGCRGNPGPGAYAFLVQNHAGEILAEGSEYESMTTNNKMELSGPIRGLKDLCEILPAKGRDPLLTKVKVITDSKYVVDGMKSWLAGWKARGWKKADGKTPENLELWQGLDQVNKNFMEIEWVWVKGHVGHPQNEYCDRKANELMDENNS